MHACAAKGGAANPKDHTMQYKFFRTYSEAIAFAAVKEAEGYSTAVLISGEVRFWK